MPETCGWLIEVDAVAYRNRDYDEMVASLSDEEIEQYGMPEPWYPDSAADAVMLVECGAPVAEGAEHALCTYHEDAMALSDLEFEQAVEAGTSFSGVLR